MNLRKFGAFRRLSRGTWIARRALFSCYCLDACGPSRYSGNNPVVNVRVAVIAAAVVLSSASSALADKRSDAKEQVAFGISVAQRGLWREAIYRWQKAVEIDPTYAAAYNDLAIAYEHEGDLDKARKAYEKALDLEPNNLQIRQNFELFKEINDRSTRGDDAKGQ